MYLFVLKRITTDDKKRHATVPDLARAVNNYERHARSNVVVYEK